MTVYPNAGKTPISSDESFWGDSAVIFNPEEEYNLHLNRRPLHLTDWDGDGACDIVYINDLANGKVEHLFINK